MEDRYQRQLLLDDISIRGQKKLSKAKVLVIGAGGLGCPALTYLVAAGIGHIVIADHDTISLSNLNRQFLYGDGDLGSYKADVAKDRLQQQNDLINITAIHEKVTIDNVDTLLKSVDVVVDCVDNVATRLLMNQRCLEQNIPLVEGGVQGFYGFATVIIRDHACLTCMGYKEVQSQGPLPVIGVTAGTIGTIEASECIRLILGYPSSLVGKMLQYDGIQHTMTKVAVKISPDCLTHQSLERR